jgi:hypothetical protein
MLISYYECKWLYERGSQLSARSTYSEIRFAIAHITYYAKVVNCSRMFKLLLGPEYYLAMMITIKIMSNIMKTMARLQNTWKGNKQRNRYPDFLALWSSSIARSCEHFGTWISFRLQVRGRKYPLRKSSFNQWTQQGRWLRTHTVSETLCLLAI